MKPRLPKPSKKEWLTILNPIKMIALVIAQVSLTWSSGDLNLGTKFFDNMLRFFLGVYDIALNI